MSVAENNKFNIYFRKKKYRNKNKMKRFNENQINQGNKYVNVKLLIVK